MEEAKSVALGGRRIYADQSILKIVEDINDLGLKCVQCGEQVFYKDGIKKISHFSHYPELDEREFEFCPIKQKNSSLFRQISLSTIPPRKQRLEIFQNKFLNIFFKYNFEFEERSKFPKINSRRIENLILFFRRNLLPIISACISASQDIYADDAENDGQLRERILIEAIDYLAVSGSRPVLEEILQYIFHKQFRQDVTTDQFYKTFCTSMGQVDWLQAFKEVNDIYGRDESITTKLSRRDVNRTKTESNIGNEKQKTPPRGGNKTVTIRLTREEYFNGCEREIEFERLVLCKDCNGSGLTSESTGSCKTLKCSCNKGRRSQKETVKVLIPRHWRQRIVPGWGNEGIDGGKNGDLIVKIKNVYLF